MEISCKEEISLQTIGDESASMAIAKEALMKALLKCLAGHNWNWEDRFLHFLQVNLRGRSEIQVGPLGRNSLLGCFDLHYATKEDDIDIPEWTIDKWRLVSFSAKALFVAADRILDIESSVVVAHCDALKLKMPDYVKKGVVRYNSLDWVPVLVGFNESGTIGGYEDLFKFSYERLIKSNLFSFTPVPVEVALEY